MPQRAGEWEKIGEISPTAGDDLKRVPKWVQKAIDHMYPPGRFRENKAVILKGRTFEYGVETLGTGGNYIYIFRRKRRR